MARSRENDPDAAKFHTKPSTAHHGDLYTVRIYTDESTDPHVYDDVKHCWFKNNGGLLCICQYIAGEFDGRTAFRFVYWPVRQVIWYQVTPGWVEDQ